MNKLQLDPKLNNFYSFLSIWNARKRIMNTIRVFPGITKNIFKFSS